MIDTASCFLSEKIASVNNVFSKKYQEAVLFEKIGDVNSKLHFLTTARIDLKNNKDKDSRLFIKSSFPARIGYPQWYKNERGIGTQIEACGKEAEFFILCNNDGDFSVVLRGIDRRNEDGERYQLWIDYKSCEINGKNILSRDIIPVWHDKPFSYSFPVKKNDVIQLNIKWNIHVYKMEELEKLFPLLHDGDISTEKKKMLIKQIKTLIEI